MFIVVPMSKNRMFPLNFRENSINLANMEYKDISWLWHLRYGHLNFHSLKLLTLKELVYGFLKVEENNEVCEGCAKGKNGRENFLRGKERRAQYPLHLVHSYNLVQSRQRVWIIHCILLVLLMITHECVGFFS